MGKLFDETKAAEIRKLNDAFRQTFVGGVIVVTAGFESLDPKVRAEAKS